MTAFPYSEKSACIISGYTRDMLRKMRKGYTQKCGDGLSETAASLIDGTDYIVSYACKEDEQAKINGRVFYSVECVDRLAAKKQVK
jgi:hypothetical protein